jgi:hypothetical protein
MNELQSSFDNAFQRLISVDEAIGKIWESAT